MRASHTQLCVPLPGRKAVSLEMKKGTVLVVCIVRQMPVVVVDSSVYLSHQAKSSGNFSLKPVEILISGIFNVWF